MDARIKTLSSYVLPSVGGLCVTYLYNIVDGIFVGQGVGPAALGAVNIGVPFITFVVAAAAMFPMGGATITAIRMGRGDQEGANHAFMTALIMTALLAVGLMAVGMIFAGEIVLISGADRLSEEMAHMAAEYLFYYSAFSVPMLMSTCLSVFVRNDGSPALAFAGMCIGALSNIFLDWLFIFPLQKGIVGAAIASGLGQVFSVIVLLSHFFLKKGALRIKRFSVKFSLAGKVCKRGLPEAASQLTTPVTALCYNIMLASLAGDMGISTFSVLSFIFSLANAVLSGVAQGLQPLWGRRFGEQDEKEMKFYFKSGMILNFILSTGIYAVLVAFAPLAIRVFSKDDRLVEAGAAALPVFALSFIPMAWNLIFTAYLFSTKRTKQANVIAVSRGIVIKAAAIFLMPVLFGSEAIWAAPAVAEVFTLLLAGVILALG
ncbi:MAG TPA: MATE family efflux transporter [Lachnospiraceae bacterium]|nr:MATE family efflux transporter [Lachnospiraceae bacterium]